MTTMTKVTEAIRFAARDHATEAGREARANLPHDFTEDDANEAFRYPLSGEFSDDLTPAQLPAMFSLSDPSDEDVDYLADEYEEAYYLGYCEVDAL